MNDRKVTLVVTSCGRFDLLEKTLISFFKYNTYPIEECIIVEDSGTVKDLNFLNNILKVPTRFLINPQNLGQMPSIDRAYTEVKTSYIFHCEDDWEFYKPGFIEESFKVLDADPRVFTVWLRAHNDTNNHPIEPEVHQIGDVKYYYMGTKKKWFGFTLNPGLRKTADCMRFHPITALEPLVKKRGGMHVVHEVDLSVYYKDAGYKCAMVFDPEGYVKHIGWDDHLPMPWEK
jgi:hypothetical protein